MQKVGWKGNEMTLFDDRCIVGLTSPLSVNQDTVWHSMLGHVKGLFILNTI